MNNETTAILAALREALEYWTIHAKNAHQRGIINGLQIAIQKATRAANRPTAQKKER